MKLQIIGQDSLARATSECCAKVGWFTLTTEDPDILWVCYDTPIVLDDKPDVDWVVEEIGKNLPTSTRTLILVSSQVPVGTTARLEALYPGYVFAHSPENIRVATAVEDFQNQSRIVVGIRTDKFRGLVDELLFPFTAKIIYTDPETAEMCKHALNCYLGLNIAFINEVARICAQVGADASVVSQALKLDPRVSPKAPLKPGAPFGGGHLARDIYTISQIGKKLGIPTPIISHIKESNEVKSN